MSDFIDHLDDVEALHAELQRKEGDLLLAARAGKNLLKENEELQEDLKLLQSDLTALEKMLETQKHDSLRSLSEAKMVAELRISELEDELEKCRRNLKLEKTDAISAKEEFSRSHEQLNKENSQLKTHLAQVTEKHKIKLKELHKRLEESEEQKEIITQDRSQAKQSLGELLGEKKALDQNLSSMYGSCEKLALELEELREKAGFWEGQYHNHQELLLTQTKELDESRDLLSELQMQLDQKPPEVVKNLESRSSSVSLYEELSQLDELEQSMGEEESSNDSALSYFSDNAGDGCLTLRPTSTPKVASLTPSSSILMGQQGKDNRALQEGPCQRCQELEAKTFKQDTELKEVNEMLLLAACQKFKLQQEIQAWEHDMALVLDAQVTECAKGRGHKCKSQNGNIVMKRSNVFVSVPYVFIRNKTQQLM